MPQVEIDFGRADIPKQTYRLRIDRATYTEPRDVDEEGIGEDGKKKWPYIAMSLKIVGGDFDDTQVGTIVSLSPNPNAIKNLKKLLEAATEDTWDTKRPITVDDDDNQVQELLGEVVGGMLVTNNGADGVERTQVQMNSWVSASKLDEAEDFAEDEQDRHF